MDVPDHEAEVKLDRVMLGRIRRQLRRESAFAHLLRVVTSVSNGAATLEEALQATLDAVCASTGWPVGHALLKVENREEVSSTGLWHLDGPERFNLHADMRLLSGVHHRPGAGPGPAGSRKASRKRPSGDSVH